MLSTLRLLVEVRPVGLGVDVLDSQRARLGKVLSGHVEVLVLQLLDSAFKSSVLVSELNQLSVHLVD